MKAMVLDQFGGPEVLHMAEIERPVALPGNVIVQVAYAGVNPADWKSCEGWLAPYFEYQFPFVVGFDAAGAIAEVGPDVTGLAVGDRVVTPGNQGLGERGSYAEYMAAAVERVIKLPDHVALRDAATLPTAGMTAWEATCDNGRAAQGSRILINGGAGGTGSFAIQIARLMGAQVAVTCSAANFDYVRTLGAELAIDYTQGNVVEQARQWAPEGLDLVVDTVGQGSLVDILPAMKRGGVICPIGTLIAGEPQIDRDAAAALDVSVVLTISNFANQPRQLRALVDALAARTIITPAVQIVPLDQAAEAHRRVRAGHVRGKILLEVDAALR